MGEPISKTIAQLKPGDVLAQDILAGVQVLLRRGTALSGAQIDRLKRMNIDSVRIEGTETAAPTPVESIKTEPQVPAEVPMPSFASLTSNDAPSWISDGNFSLPVPTKASSAAERIFRDLKTALREQAGLMPLIDPVKDEELMRRLEAAFIQSAVQQEVTLDRLASVAAELSQALDTKGQYINVSSDKHFTANNDIARHGQHLIASCMQSAKMYRMLVMDQPSERFEEELKAHFAMSSVFVLLPSQYYTHSVTTQGDAPLLERAITRYTEWLAGQQFVPLDVLAATQKRLLCQHNSEPSAARSCTGLPPGLQRWTISGFYSQRLYSLPNRPRLTPHDAAQQVVQYSEQLFSSKEVNYFLQKIGFFPLGSLVELSNDEMALVVRQNKNAMFKPVVQLVTSSGELGEEQDLLKSRDVYVKRQVLEY